MKILKTQPAGETTSTGTATVGASLMTPVAVPSREVPAIAATETPLRNGEKR